MSSGGGGSETTSNVPWNAAFVLPADNSSYQDFLNGSLTPAYYPGSTVSPLSSQTQQAISMQGNAAGSAQNDVNAGDATMQSMLSPSYDTSNPAFGYLGGMASGTAEPTAGINNFASLQASTPMQGAQSFAQLGNNFQNPTAGTMMLGGLASQGATNPELNQMYNLAAGQVGAQIDGQAEAAGRYGSGAQAAAKGSALDNLATNMYGQEYDNNMNRQLSATQSLASNQNAQQQNQLSAASGFTNALQGAQNEQLTAASGIQSGLQSNAADQINAGTTLGNDYNTQAQQQLQAMMFSPQMANAQSYPSQAMASAGNSQDAYNQAVLNSQIQAYNYNANSDYMGLQKYLGLISGNSGNQTTTSMTPSSGNTAGMITGGVAAGAGLLSSLGGSGGLISALAAL